MLVEPGHAGHARTEHSHEAAIEAFRDVADAITDDLPLDVLLHLVASQVCRLLGIRRCSVYLKDPESGLFRGQVAETGSNQDDAIKRLTCGGPADGFTREIVTEKAPVLISNARRDPRPVRAVMHAWGVRSMLGVPMLLRHNVIGILFLDNASEPHEYTPDQQAVAATFANLAAVAISQSQRAAELRASVKTVVRQNQVLRKAAAIEDRLTRLAVAGASLQETIAAVAMLTQKPGAVYDSGYRRVAVGQPPGLPDAPTPRLLEPQFRELPQVVEALSEVEARGAVVVGPFPELGLPHRFLLAPVTVGEERWGWLVVMEYGSLFAALDTVTAKRAATIVTLALATERRVANADNHARESLLRDLIVGSDAPENLQRRAEFHGVDPDGCYVACVGAGGDDDDPPVSPRDLEDAWARLELPGSVWAATVDQRAVLLVELDQAKPRRQALSDAKAAVQRVNAELDPDGDLRWGISAPFQGALDLPRGYEEAADVLGCLIALSSSPSRVRELTADDLGAGRLFLGQTDRTQADRFVDDTLGGLLQTTDLVSTLQVFFDSGRSVRQAALRLGVHENTVRYRLSRAEQATGLDAIADADDQLAIQVALLILRLEGRLSMEAPEPAAA